jgi:hypothetical protein
MIFGEVFFKNSEWELFKIFSKSGFIHNNSAHAMGVLAPGAPFSGQNRVILGGWLFVG